MALKTTFTNYRVSDFKPAPLKGLYEVHSGDQIIYFSPEDELLIFGQIYNSNGENLTEKARRASVLSKLTQLPLASAVTLQEGDIPLIEIMNPDCGYCRRSDHWLESQKDNYSIERKVIFMNTERFTEAAAKIKYVLCATDQQQAYRKIMLGKELVDPEIDCPEATQTLAQHSQIVDALGISGTPTYLLPSGSMIVGFKTSELENYLRKESED
jgi:thiol:disulfide interchange protein DsbC